MKIRILRSLTCCLLLLSTVAGQLRANHAADLRNERIPPGAVMTPPWHKYTGIVPASGGPTGYTPQQMRHAYGVDQLNTTGQGQVIAIVDAYGSPTMQADLDTFCQAMGIPSTTVQVYYPQGQPVANSGWATETSLDVEWAHAIAPGATIVLIATQDNSDAALYAGVDFASSTGATQVSLSWGQPELSDETTSDFHFNIPGVTVFVSSGDNGAGVSYPSSSPYVVAVGGTTLNLDSSGNITAETAWSGSGGGPSVYETAPSYQANWWNGAMRGVPDVAYDADPKTGVPVYMTGPGWQQIGGTSMSAPQWAALSALANSLRQQSVNSAPGVFYSLATANYSAYYHDIISGNNGAYSCGPGYDLVTGLGTPVANNLVIALAGGFSSQVAAPVFFPGAGVYPSASVQNVTIVSATPGASIRYTIDGSTPTETVGALYTGPVQISVNTTLMAIAYKSGLTDSPVTSGKYTFLPQVATPTFSPGAGTYTIGQVTISTTTPGASIRYTTDGSTPTETIGTLYSGVANLDGTGSLKAIAYESGFLDSPVAIGTYTLNLPSYPTAPTLSPAPGTYAYASAQTVTISAMPSGIEVNYTTDGSTPTVTNGTLYSGPLSLNSTTVLKAAAYEHGVYSAGPVSGGIYTITASPAVVLNVMHDFTIDNQGTPLRNLVQGSDGNFYGTIANGGSYGLGTVFKMTPSGVVTTLVSFDWTHGAAPDAGLIKGNDGNFYGTTLAGGGNSGYGTVFKMTPAGVLTTVASFNGINGNQPGGVLVQGSDGNFYGTTYIGGSTFVNGSNSGDGTVFKMTPAGVLTSLVSFDGPNGVNPQGGLVQGSDGNFYGTTLDGGSGYGTIFKITPMGVLTTLVSFDGADGSGPFDPVILGSDGNFYGTTYIAGSSGPNNYGNVFKMTPAGALTTLVLFNGADGAFPYGGLAQGRDGNFYGTTEGGGSGNLGTFFRLTPAGVLTTLVSFDGDNGANPTANLLMGSDGNFYGMASLGGVSNDGVAYQVILPAPAQQVSAPSFSPAAGIYTSAPTVTITSATSGATIAYTTDGSTPTETNGIVLTNGGSISIATSATLQAMAYKSGFADSGVTTGAYTISVTVSSGNGFYNTPLSPPQSGTFTATFDASSSLSPINAVIGLSKGTQTAYTGLSCIARFNTSGDIDSYNGTAYQAASVIPYAKNTTYHFRMVVNVPANTYSVYVTPAGGSELTVGLNYKFRAAVTSLDTWTIDVNSSPGGTVTVSNRTISGTQQVAAPTFNPLAGTYTSAQTVTITSATSGATIVYTTDGTAPTESGGTVTHGTVLPIGGSVTISVTTTLKAMAFKSGMTDSPVTTGLYTISTSQVAAPTFNPPAGTYTSAQTVTITSTTSGASIAYTTDGTTPTESGGAITHGTALANGGAVTINVTTTLKALAFKSGMTDSTVTTGVYTISVVTRSLTGTSSNGWHALALTSAQTGTFTATFDATPTISPENAVVGLSKGVATAYTGLSCIARFNTSGDIDAYNGTTYQAASVIPYAKNMAYHFRMVVNVPAHTYSVYVTPPGQSELTVGLNYAFRVAQASLDTWNLDVNATPSGCSLTANNLNP